MSTPARIATATLALQKLIQSAVPPGVEVTTLAPALAEQFKPKTGLLARVNLSLLRISSSKFSGPVPPARPGSGPPPLPPVALDLHYLVSAYGTAAPAAEPSKERLLETVLELFHGHPILTRAELSAAFPVGNASDNATILLEDLPNGELRNLFTDCGAHWQPALTYLVQMRTAT